MLNTQELEALLAEATCNLLTRPGNRVSGALYEVECHGQILSLFIAKTNGQSNGWLNEPALHFHNRLRDWRVRFTKQTVRTQYNARNLGCIVVELKDEFANECKLHGIKFLKIGDLRLEQLVYTLFF